MIVGVDGLGHLWFSGTAEGIVEKPATGPSGIMAHEMVDVGYHDEEVLRGNKDKWISISKT